MSAPINDGGPAYPVADSHYPNGEIQYGSNGMSLRDYLAGQAMAGHCAADISFEHNATKLAEWSYQAADAMIAARERRAE